MNANLTYVTKTDVLVYYAGKPLELQAEGYMFEYCI